MAKVTGFTFHDRNYPDLSILQRDMLAIRRAKNEAQSNLDFSEQYGLTEKAELYRKEVRRYEYSEREMDAKIKRAEKEMNSHNFLCPEGYIWIEKHYTKRGTVNGFCRKESRRR
jgi:hypothetical protein